MNMELYNALASTKLELPKFCRLLSLARTGSFLGHQVTEVSPSEQREIPQRRGVEFQLITSSEPRTVFIPYEPEAFAKLLDQLKENQTTWPSALEKIKRGEIDVKRLSTHSKNAFAPCVSTRQVGCCKGTFRFRCTAV